MRAIIGVHSVMQTLLFEGDDMAGKKSGKKGERSIFGQCLLQLRKEKGWTQAELAERAGLSRRMIAHYERLGEQIPVNHLINFARTFGVSFDRLLGLKPIKENTSPKTARLLNRLRRIEQLPDKDRRAVLDYVDLLFSKQQLQKMAK